MQRTALAATLRFLLVREPAEERERDAEQEHRVTDHPHERSADPLIGQGVETVPRGALRVMRIEQPGREGEDAAEQRVLRRAGEQQIDDPRGVGQRPRKGTGSMTTLQKSIAAPK